MSKKDIRLNSKLVSALSSALYMSPAELMKMAAIPHSTWYNIKQDPTILTIQHLLAIANGAHVPVRRFFSTGEVDIVGRRDEYVTEPYQTCYYDADALQRAFDDRPDATWKRASEIVGMTPQRLKGSMMTLTRTPVTRFLYICSLFDIDPFTVLIDPNPGWDKDKRTAGRKQQGAEMAQKIDALRDDIRKLSTAVDEITRKYEDLLGAHRALAQRIDDHIRGGRIVIIADDAPKPKAD